MPRSQSSRRRPRALALLCATGAGLLVTAIAAPAWAHVTVTPTSAEPGASTELSFRVPNEEANAVTTKVSIQIPTQHPIAQLLASPVSGWSITEKTTNLAKPLVTDDGSFSKVVSQVTWSGGQILPGEFQDFVLSADPLPDEPVTLTFKALQNYSNGDVVRWIDIQQPGQPEPEHPAPILTVGGSGSSVSPTPITPTMTMPAVNTTSSGSGTKTLAIISLVVALLALAAAVGGQLLQSRRTD